MFRADQRGVARSRVIGVTAAAPNRRVTRRQAELLNRLLELFLAEGFSQFTLDDLAARLHCSKTTLYQIAPSKEQLSAAVVVHFFRRTTDFVEHHVAQAGTPAERIATYLRAAAAALKPASRAFLADMAAFGPARAVYERNTRIAADWVRDLLREGRVSGDFRDLDDAFVGEVVAQVMHGIVTGDLTRRTGLTDAQAYERLARLVLAAVTSGGR
jgi:AcrR family transcriptional regulator